MDSSSIPVAVTGARLSAVYSEIGAIARLLKVPEISDAIRSRIGGASTLDRHFLHMTFPPAFYERNAPVP